MLYNTYSCSFAYASKSLSGFCPRYWYIGYVVFVHLTSRSLFDPIHSTKEKQPSFFLGSLRLAASGALGDLALGLVGTRGGSLGQVLGLVAGGSSRLLGGGGGRAAKVDQANDDGNERNENSANTTSNLRDKLNGLNGVSLGNGDEQVKLLLDVGDGVIEEDEVRRRLGDVVNLGLVSLLKSLFNGVLDEEGLVGQLLGILNGVANVDVVKEDVVGHGPDLEANLQSTQLASRLI